MTIYCREISLDRNIPYLENERDQRIPGIDMPLNANMQLASRILASSAEAIFALDFDGTVLFWNPAAAHLYGWSADEVVGRSTFDLMPGSTESERTRQALKEMRHRESWTRELNLVRKDGSSFPGEVTLSRLTDDEGNPVGIVGVTSDITSRRRAEQRLNILYSVTRLLSGSRDVSSVGERILKAICQEIHWDWGALWLTDEETNTLYCVAIWDGNKEQLSMFSSVSRVFRYQRGSGLPGGAWDSGAPDWVEDIQHEHRMIRRRAALEVGLISAMEVPIQAGPQRVRGVIELMSSTRAAHDDQVLEMVSAAARQLGLIIERQRIADVLRVHESRLRQLEESELIGIFRADLDGAMIEANEAFLKMTGYTREDLGLGMSLDRLTPPEWRHVVDMIRGNLETTGRSPQTEMELSHRSGSRISILLGATMLESTQKEMVAFVVDITARKQAEREREESLKRERAARLAAEDAQHRLTMLAEAGALLSSSLNTRLTLRQLSEMLVPQMGSWCAITIADTDTSSRKVAVSHADPEMKTWAQDFRRHLLEETDEFFGLTSVISERTPRVFEQIQQEVLTTVPLDEVTRQFLSQAGATSSVIVPVVLRNEAVGAITLVHTRPSMSYNDDDVTLIEDIAHRIAMAIENARLYEASQRNARHLDAIAEISNVFAEASHNADAVVQSFARLMTERVGDWAVVRLPSDDGVWLRPVAVHHPDPGAVSFLEALFRETPLRFNEGMAGKVAASGDALMIPSIAPEELRNIVRPAFNSWMEFRPMYGVLVVPMRRRNQVVGTIALIRNRPDVPYTTEDLRFVQNVADRAALALENAQLFHEAQEAVRLREEFLSIASHEMRTPLTTITGFSHLLHRQVSQGMINTGHLETISTSLLSEATRLDQLVGDLLDVSRIQQGRLDIRPEPCDLSRILQTTVARIQAGQDATTRREIIIDAQPDVHGVWDARRIDQVVTNLLTNALKYSRDGEIRVTLGVEFDDCAVLTVSDQGIGIPLDEQERLFEPFARGSEAHQVASGTGLGLYIARQIIEHHGGTIDLASAPGEGATFTIRLPMDNDSDE